MSKESDLKPRALIGAPAEAPAEYFQCPDPAGAEGEPVAAATLFARTLAEGAPANTFLRLYTQELLVLGPGMAKWEPVDEKDFQATPRGGRELGKAAIAIRQAGRDTLVLAAVRSEDNSHYATGIRLAVAEPLPALNALAAKGVKPAWVIRDVGCWILWIPLTEAVPLWQEESRRQLKKTYDALEGKVGSNNMAMESDRSWGTPEGLNALLPIPGCILQGVQVEAYTGGEIESYGISDLLGRFTKTLFVNRSIAERYGPRKPEVEQISSWKRTASGWRVTYDGKTVDLPAQNGFLMIATLIREPGHRLRYRKLYALVNASPEDAPTAHVPAGEDDKGHPGHRKHRATTELLGEEGQHTGRRRGRPSDDGAGKAARNVNKAIDNAMGLLEVEHAALFTHLRATLRRHHGDGHEYHPLDPPVKWEVALNLKDSTAGRDRGKASTIRRSMKRAENADK